MRPNNWKQDPASTDYLEQVKERAREQQIVEAEEKRKEDVRKLVESLPNPALFTKYFGFDDLLIKKHPEYHGAILVGEQAKIEPVRANLRKLYEILGKKRTIPGQFEPLIMQGCALEMELDEACAEGRQAGLHVLVDFPYCSVLGGRNSPSAPLETDYTRLTSMFVGYFSRKTTDGVVGEFLSLSIPQDSFPKQWQEVFQQVKVGCIEI